jgi:hypothetical protein
MTANPLTNLVVRHNRKPVANSAGKWSLDHTADDPELERLERYVAEMNARDPLRRKWVVAKRTDEQGEVVRFVDCQG